MALEDSGLEINDDNRYDIGVVYGSGGGGQGLFILNQEIWHTKGVRAVSPFFIANGLVDASSGTIAIENRGQGPQLLPGRRVLNGHAGHRRGRGGDPAGRLHRSHHRFRPSRRSWNWSTSASRTCAAWARPCRASPSAQSAGRLTHP